MARILFKYSTIRTNDGTWQLHRAGRDNERQNRCIPTMRGKHFCQSEKGTIPLRLCVPDGTPDQPH